MIAKVITEVALDREFDYLVPSELQSQVTVGTAVMVPFGNTRRFGWVVSVADTSQYPAERLKAIVATAPERASIPPKLVELGKWIAEYYCSTQEQAIRTLLPAAVRNGKVKAKIRKFYFIPNRADAEKFITDNGDKKTAATRCAILRLLLSEGSISSDGLRRTAFFSASALTTLKRDNLVADREEQVRRDVFGVGEVVRSQPLPPSPEQQKALDAIRAALDGTADSHVVLLHGVTNSGKTEVYLQAIAETISRGKSAIVLVPEISLTPQTVQRFRARFGDELSVLHSRLTDGERFDEWNRINSGKVNIVVGARSALFAPLRNLGLIVVDEEHDSSYKQSEAPHYHARDVAVMRGKREGAVVILGSATPALESLYNASVGKFTLVRMAAQVGNRPETIVRLIDRRLETASDAKASVLSRGLVEAVQERLEAGEQVILFLNKRGYARSMTCKCGFEARCDNCSVNYTYSKLRGTLSCHYCGDVIPAYKVCPQCGSPEISYQGAGTEKIENIVRAQFPNARVGRMDSDVMRSASDYENTLNDFRRGNLDILVGTQMIAKGLHFPNVTLVGLVNADIGLQMPDFRAGERIFQLITQVAGRAGRGDRRGEALIQTFHPENDTIYFASRLDFAGFQKFELEFREMLGYPPFGRLIAVIFRGENEELVKAYAEKFAETLQPYATGDVQMSQPVPAPLERLKGKYRYMLTIRGTQLKLMRQALRALALHGNPPRGVEVAVDVDAQDLL